MIHSSWGGCDFIAAFHLSYQRKSLNKMEGIPKSLVLQQKGRCISSPKFVEGGDGRKKNPWKPKRLT